MNGTNRPDAVTALALLEPEANVLYSIERAAQFTGMPRRHIVLYARRGFVTPAIDPAETGWYFTAETIRTLRRLEMLRAMHSLDWPGMKLVLGLMTEVERLREELLGFQSSRPQPSR